MLFGKRRRLAAAIRARDAGQLEAAREAFEQYLNRAPGDVEARRMCAELLVALGDTPAAVAHYEVLTGALVEAGLGLRAIAVCCTILRLQPDHEGTQQALAALSSTRNVDAARVMTAAMKRGATPPPLPDDEFDEVDEGFVIAESGRTAGELPLHEIPLFSALDAAALVELIGTLEVWTAPKGSAVIRQGEAGESFFVIVRGVARVERTQPSGESEWISVLQAGDFFGESAALASLPRTSTVVAQSELELLELHRDRMQALCARHPQVERALRRFQRKRFIANLMHTSPFVDVAPAVQRGAVREMRDRHVQPGQVLVEPGARRSALFIVLAGDVRQGDAMVEEFGRFGGLDDSPAPEQVVASSAAHLLVLTRKSAARLEARCPELALALTSSPAAGDRAPG